MNMHKFNTANKITLVCTFYVFPSRSVFVHLSMSFEPSFYLFVRLSVQPSVCLFVSPFVQYFSSVHPSVCLTILPLESASFERGFNWNFFIPSVCPSIWILRRVLEHWATLILAKSDLFYVLRGKESPLDLLKIRQKKNFIGIDLFFE